MVYKNTKNMDAQQRKEEYIKNVADKFIEGLKAGKVPWMKPWNPVLNIPDFNMETNKYKIKKGVQNIQCYQGMNAMLTMMTRSMILQTDDPRWLTWVQMAEINKKADPKDQIYMHKGTKGLAIQRYDIAYYKNGKQIHFDETPKKEEYDYARPYLKNAVIFNASQFFKKCYDKEGNPILDEKGNPKEKPAFEPFVIEENEKTKIDFKPIEKAENILKSSGANIVHDQSNRCYYWEGDDCIHLVPKEHFKSEQDYYDTALHELTHWTGGEKRLNREELKKYGESDKYRAMEELNAEIGGFMLAQKCNIAFNPSKNNVSYVNNWVSILEDQPDAIFKACKNAMDAVSFITDKTDKREEQKEETENIQITISKPRSHSR